VSLFSDFLFPNRTGDLPFYFIFFRHPSLKFLMNCFMDRGFDFEGVKYKRFSKAANEESTESAS